MRHPPIPLTAIALALTLALPGRAEAGPEERSASLVKVFVAIAARRAATQGGPGHAPPARPRTTRQTAPRAPSPGSARADALVLDTHDPGPLVR